MKCHDCARPVRLRADDVRRTPADVAYVEGAACRTVTPGNTGDEKLGAAPYTR